MQKHTVYFILLFSLLFASFRPASAALFPRFGHRAAEEAMADMVAVEAPADTMDALLDEMVDLRLRVDSLQHLLDGMELSAIAEEQAAAERPKTAKRSAEEFSC